MSNGLDYNYELESRSALPSGVNYEFLYSLSNSLFLYERNDGTIDKKEIDMVKNRIHKSMSYFCEVISSGSERIPQKLDTGHLLTLLMCLNYFEKNKHLFIENDEINKKLTNKSYADGYYFKSPYKIIRDYNENGVFKEEYSDDNYVAYEDAISCLELMYKYLNASSLSDYEFSLKNTDNKTTNLDKVVTNTNGVLTKELQ